MKVALIRPPTLQGDLIKAGFVQHPINILYLASMLKKYGHDVELFDHEVEEFSVDKIREFSPNIVGVTAITPRIEKANEIIKAIKAAMPVVGIVGGPHPTALPKETLEEFRDIDICVTGEGEYSLLEICEALEKGGELSGIKGIAFRDNGRIVVNERRPPIANLDDLPFPDRDLLKHSLYKGASTPGFSRHFLNITEIYTSRGCPFSCIFCAAWETHGRAVRYRSIDNLIEEMKQCIEKYKINHFTIDDDNFTLRKNRVLEFCEKVKGMNITWDCDSRVTIDKETVDAMARAGCKKISFGVESGSPRVLQLNRKSITLDQVRNAIKLAKDAGMQITAFYMIGSHPDETLEDIELTKKLIRETEPDYITASIAIPFPGTELYNIMEKNNLILEKKWSNFAFFNTKPTWKTFHFSPDDLVSIQNDMLKWFYMRPSYILRRIGKIRSYGELSYWAGSGIALLKYLFLRKHA